MPTTPKITLRITTPSKAPHDLSHWSWSNQVDPTLNAEGTFVSQLPDQLSAELRWYMEQFLNERDDASLVRAKRIRESIKVCGKRLFQGLFQANADARAIWRRIAPDSVTRRSRLSKAVNTVACRGNSCAIRQLTCRFVFRQPHSSVVTERVPSDSVRLAKLKVLLVISRPDGTSDVELRTIASSIYSSLRASSRFQVDMLRPSTYETLEHTLHDAAEQNDPYDIVHFDGHGFYQSPGVTDSGERYGGGYLVFEHDSSEHGDPISGDAFGSLATECGVRALCSMLVGLLIRDLQMTTPITLIAPRLRSLMPCWPQECRQLLP